MELTLKIDNRSKVGKTLLRFIEIFAKENKEIVSAMGHYRVKYICNS